MKPRWLGPFIITKIMSWGCYKNYKFGWERDASPNQHGLTSKIPHLIRKNKKKKVCQVENPKGRPRQNLRLKDPARLKTRKGDLGKRQGNDHGHGKNSSMDVMGKNYMAQEKEQKKKKKRKIMTISKDKKWVVLSLLKLKDGKLFLQEMWNIPVLY